MMNLTKIATMAMLGLSALQNVAGHMRLFAPIPRGDARIQKQYFGIADYDLNAPLNDHRFLGKFPCRHQRKGPVMAKYTAGKSFPVMFKTGNSHRGGHCQFAISYDNGQNWVVLKTIIDLCFLDKAPWVYNIPLPKGAKNGEAIFAWTWMNAEGNREYYMNCVDIEINGGSNTGSLTGPELFVGQLPGRPRIPEWANTDAKKDGKEHFFNRKIVTIPSGAQPTREGTVVGEGGNGRKPVNMPPAKLPWNRFHNDDAAREDNSVRTVFIATNDNPGIGVKGNSEANHPYVKGDSSESSGKEEKSDKGKSKKRKKVMKCQEVYEDE
ncbi:hypothetical protein BDF19DRAFT_439511 [Syncephalis fuscata]|nr:hypothetical protein BDF19DRAFT_439511 [Syncephalis fuscata]